MSPETVDLTQTFLWWGLAAAAIYAFREPIRILARRLALRQAKVSTLFFTVTVDVEDSPGRPKTFNSPFLLELVQEYTDRTPEALLEEAIQDRMEIPITFGHLAVLREMLKLDEPAQLSEIHKIVGGEETISREDLRDQMNRLIDESLVADHLRGKVGEEMKEAPISYSLTAAGTLFGLLYKGGLIQ